MRELIFGFQTHLLWFLASTFFAFGCAPNVVMSGAEPLEIVDTWPLQGARVTPATSEVRLRFNKALSPLSVSHASVQVSPAIDYVLNVRELGRSIVVSFTSILPANADIMVSVANEVASVEGLRLGTALDLGFSTTSPLAPLSVRSLDPATGSMAGGERVLMSGGTFVGEMSVRFGSGPATVLRAESDERTLVLITPSAERSGPVDVEIIRHTDGQRWYVPAGFTYTSYVAPSALEMLPLSGAEAGGDQVVVSGVGVTPGSWVFFDDVPALDCWFEFSADGGVLNAITPPGLGEVGVRVASPSGAGTALSSPFTYVAAPTLVGINPAKGPATEVETMPGVTLSGTGFLEGARVFIGSAELNDVVVLSDTQITATLVSGSSGPATVQVLNPDAQEARLLDGFFREPPPRIAAVSPFEGPVVGGMLVRVVGSNFGSYDGNLNAVPEILFAGIAATQVELLNATTLVAVSPPVASSGPTGVTVINPDGQRHTVPAAFNALPSPTISAISPRAAYVNPRGRGNRSTTITIRGSNFATDTIALFEGQPASVTKLVDGSNGTELEVSLDSTKLPPSIAGFVTVRVQNPDGQFAERENEFHILRYYYSNCSLPGFYNCSAMPESTVSRQIEWIRVTPDAMLGAVIANASSSTRNQIAVTQKNVGIFGCAESVFEETSALLPDDTTDISYAVAVADIDGDGDDDIVFGNMGKSRVLLNDGGVFSYPTNDGLDDSDVLARDVELIDVNDDGQLDLVMAAQSSTGPVPNRLYMNQGVGADPLFVRSNEGDTYPRLPGPQKGVWNDSVGADLDGDGHIDLVFVGKAGHLEVWLNRENGNIGWGYFERQSKPLVGSPIDVASNLTGVAAGDLTNDGIIDVAVSVLGTPNFFLVGQGSGLLKVRSDLLEQRSDDSRDIEIADLNGDGFNDVFVANAYAPTRVQLYYPGLERFFDMSGIEAKTPSRVFSGILPGWTRRFMQRSATWDTYDIEVRPFDGAKDLVGRVSCGGDQVPEILYASKQQVQVATNSPEGCTGAGRPSSAVFFCLLLLWGVRRRLARIRQKLHASDLFGSRAAAANINRLGRRILPGVMCIAMATVVSSGCSAPLPAAESACTAPSPLEVWPPDSGWALRTTAIWARFDAPLAAAEAYGLEVVDANGSVVAGSTYSDGERLLFILSGPLPSNGSYQVRVRGRLAGANGCFADLMPTWTFRTPENETLAMDTLIPTAGPAAGGTRVEITGTGFIEGMAVFFGSEEVSKVTLLSDTVLRTVTPKVVTSGGVDVVAKYPTGEAVTLPSAFMYLNPEPRVITVEPKRGPVAGGTRVIITGERLAGVEEVRFRDVVATPVDQGDWTDSQIIVNTPPGVGSVAITLSRVSGERSVLADAYSYLAPPRLVRVVPEIGAAAGEFTASVYGINLGDGGLPPSVFIDGVELNSERVLPARVDGTSFDVILPPHNGGTVEIGVRNPDGQIAADTLTLMFVPPPEVPEAVPRGSTLSGGDLLTISCAAAATGGDCGFSVGSRVAFGRDCIASASCLEADYVSSSMLMVLSPLATSTGFVDLVVINADGQESEAGTYSYFIPPKIDRLRPIWGPLTGGIEVALFGTGFVQDGTLGPEVLWDGVALSTQFVSDTELRVTMPAGAQGLVRQIDVQNPDYGVAALRNAFSNRSVRVAKADHVGEGLDTPSATVGLIGSAVGFEVVRIDSALPTPIEFLRADIHGYSRRSLCNTPALNNAVAGVPLVGVDAWDGLGSFTQMAVVSSKSPYLSLAGIRAMRRSDLTDYGCPYDFRAYTFEWSTATIDDPPAEPLAMAAGDVSGDGVVDLVLGMFNTENLLFMGTVGGFVQANAEESPFTAGAQDDSLAVVVTDLNADGADDIVVANWGTVDRVYLSGSGYPLTSLNVSAFNVTARTSNTIEVADLDGDGAPDILFGGDGGVDVYRQERLSVADPTAVRFVRRDDWGFPRMIEGLTVEQTAVGDFDDDGLLDVLLIWETGSPDKYELYFGVGEGNVRKATPQEFDPSGMPTQSAIKIVGRQVYDVGADNDADLLFATSDGVDPMFVSSQSLLTEAVRTIDSHFLAAGHDSATVQAVALGAFRDNGQLQVVIWSAARSSSGTPPFRNQLSIFDQDKSGDLLPIMAVQGVGLETAFRVESLLVADADGDGDNDVLLVYSPYTSGSGLLAKWVLYGDVDPADAVPGTLSPMTAFALSSEGRQEKLSYGRSGVDQRLTMFVYYSYVASFPGALFAQDPTTTDLSLRRYLVAPVALIRHVEWADITSDPGDELVVVFDDGRLDVMTVAFDDVKYEAVLTSTNAVPSLIGLSETAVPADIDGDGDIDLVVGDIQQITVLENVGGQLARHSTVLSIRRPCRVTALEVADIDGDGDVDVLMECPEQGYGRWRVLLNQGGIRFREETGQYTAHGSPWNSQPLLPYRAAGSKIDRIFSWKRLDNVLYAHDPLP